jgi:hypothetical protein
MTIEQIRNALQATPFRPFTIHLADGREPRVPHREFLSQSPGGRTIIIFQKDENFSIVDLLLVTDLESHNGSTGTSKKRRR